jgi:beta-glucosidase
MCAYNRTNGEVCCASPSLLTTILRQEWGFDGYIVTDCWALQDFVTHHKVVETAAEAAAMAIKTTVNINCGVIYRNIPEAFAKGLITEQEIDSALAGGLKILFRLGWFDSVDNTPWKDLGNNDIATAKNRALARKTAAGSMVLLKNNGVLPLKKEIKSIYVTGPNAAAMEPLWSNYNGYSGELVTVVEGLTGKVSAHTAVSYNPGCGLTGDTIFRGTWLIGDCEAVVAVMGLNALIEGEAGDAWLSEYGGDRNEIGLPDNQVKYIQRLAREGKPVIVVVMAGSAVSLSEIEPYADAILYAWYPGEQGGNAVADILFGDINPAGRLPVTIYKSANDLPPFENYSMLGRTYRFFEGEPEYPFGFGLSFTNFEYSRFTASGSEFSVEDVIKLEVTVKNRGEANGEEVVQIYGKSHDTGCGPLLKSLVAFKRVPVAAGRDTKVEFEIPVSKLQVWDPMEEKFVNRLGEYSFFAAKSSADETHEIRVVML